MSDSTRKNALHDLDVRLKAAKLATESDLKIRDYHSGGHLAWRMVIELVAGIAIGFFIGYGLDELFGTLPVFLVVFVLLGFYAGVKTMLKTSHEVQMRQTAKVDERKEV